MKALYKISLIGRSRPISEVQRKSLYVLNVLKDDI